jgi:hypothetical protein
MPRHPRRPPLRLLKVINPCVRPILRSPFHAALSGRLLLLEYTGRSSGRTYTTPVGYVRWDDRTVVSFSSAGWWRSLLDGQPVRLLIRRRWLDAVPAVEPDPVARASVLDEFVRRFGLRLARRFYLGLPSGRTPTDEEFRRAASERAVVRFRLSQDPV